MNAFVRLLLPVCLVLFRAGSAPGQWTTGAIFSSSQQFSAALAFDANNAIFVNGGVDPWAMYGEGQIVATTSGDQGQGFVFFYPSGLTLEDVDGWAGASTTYDASYYWAVGSSRTMTNQIRRSVVVRNLPGDQPQPFQVFYTGNNRYYRCVDMLDVDNGFCGGALLNGDGIMDRTADGGSTWTCTDTFPGQIISRIRFVNDSLGFAVSNGSHWAASGAIELPDSGHVYRTTDGGASWQAVLSSAQHGFSGVWFTDTLHGSVTGNDGSIRVTSNGGDSWQLADVALAPPFLLTAVAGTPAGVLYASGYRADNSGAIILASTDGGYHWQVNHYSATGVGRRINNIYFFDDNIGYAPSWTCSWRTGNGGQLATGVPDAMASKDMLLYPNPTASEATLVVSGSMLRTVSVVDQQGRLVLPTKVVQAATCTIGVNALLPGAYTVVVLDARGRHTLPLMVQ